MKIGTEIKDQINKAEFRLLNVKAMREIKELFPTLYEMLYNNGLENYKQYSAYATDVLDIVKKLYNEPEFFEDFYRIESEVGMFKYFERYEGSPADLLKQIEFDMQPPEPEMEEIELVHNEPAPTPIEPVDDEVVAVKLETDDIEPCYQNVGVESYTPDVDESKVVTKKPWWKFWK